MNSIGLSGLHPTIRVPSRKAHYAKPHGWGPRQATGTTGCSGSMSRSTMKTPATRAGSAEAGAAATGVHNDGKRAQGSGAGSWVGVAIPGARPLTVLAAFRQTLTPSRSGGKVTTNWGRKYSGTPASRWAQKETRKAGGDADACSLSVVGEWPRGSGPGRMIESRQM